MSGYSWFSLITNIDFDQGSSGLRQVVEDTWRVRQAVEGPRTAH